MPADEFMRLALYDPEHGYYHRAGGQIGREGDFITSVSVGSLFAELLGFDFLGRLAGLETNRPSTIVECGAHDGRFAADLLGWLATWVGETPRVDYVIVEPSPARAAAQRATLGPLAGRVRWIAGWEEIPPRSLRGIVFANELLDAFPVRRFAWRAGPGRWVEQGVGLEAGRLSWTEGVGAVAAGGEREPAEQLLARQFELPDELTRVLPDGFVVEAGAEAEAWWQAAAARLEVGWLITFDYGGEAVELVSPARPAGTLRAYRGQRVSGDVLASPGAQDLTAHVNFTAVARAGEALGLRTETAMRQGPFLLGIVARIERSPDGFPPWSPARRRQLQTLVHPDHFGRAFRVLIQHRSGPSDPGVPRA